MLSKASQTYHMSLVASRRDPEQHNISRPGVYHLTVRLYRDPGSAFFTSFSTHGSAHGSASSLPRTPLRASCARPSRPFTARFSGACIPEPAITPSHASPCRARLPSSAAAPCRRFSEAAHSRAPEPRCSCFPRDLTVQDPCSIPADHRCALATEVKTPFSSCLRFRPADYSGPNNLTTP